MITFNLLGRLGRLGNQLFQIAATIGVARRNGQDYAFPPWDYAAYFTGPLPQMERSALDFPILFGHTYRYFPIDVAMSINLWGVFQSEKFFAHCAEEVRRVLSPRPDIESAIRVGLIKHLQDTHGDISGRRICAVHVRRGDYAGNANYFDLAASSYYENAFRRFAPNTIFVIVSDDIPWCKQRFSDRMLVYVEGSGIESLVLMSICDAVIMANSSFSWWGAWLNERPGKTIVAPNRWFDGPAADPAKPFDPYTLAGYTDTRDLIPERWHLCSTDPSPAPTRSSQEAPRPLA